MADTSAHRPEGDPLAAYCCACLAPPGEPCVGTTSNLPRERPHRLRPLAAAAHLTHCPDCEGSGWQATAPRLAPQVTCPVCGAEPVAPCTEGGAKRRDLHVVRRRAARAGLEPCGTCDAVGWVPAGEPEPSAPRPDVPARGVHVIPGQVPEGVVPPSTSMATRRPAAPETPMPPREWLNLFSIHTRAAAAVGWQMGWKAGYAVAYAARPDAPRPDAPDELLSRFDEEISEAIVELTTAVMADVSPNLAEFQRQVRERVAAEITDPSVWPDSFGNWTAEQADAARAMKEHILRRIARGES